MTSATHFSEPTPDTPDHEARTSTHTPVETIALTKRYGTNLAVDGLDLRVETGEVYGFLGPNGAGKTTTLRMLLGLVRPTSGRVRLFGAAPGPGQLTRVGALIEGPAFYPYLSARDNLRTFAAHADVPSSRVEQVLEIVDLSARSRDRYSTYSLGMKQRLGLAAALLKEPTLLILDEPTNGLDPAGMADMRVTIRTLASEGCTVLLSSHLLAEVQQVCDRVGVIAKGRLVSESTVEAMTAGGTLRVRADRISEAHSIVSSVVGADRVAVVEVSDPVGANPRQVLDIDVAPAQAGPINTVLVRAGLVVDEVRWCPPDLEAVFLELTGGRRDVA